MKKHLVIFFLIASLLGISACQDFNEQHFKELEEMTTPENVLNKDYTLTADDYSTISGLSVDGVPSSALKVVKGNQYLTPETDPRVVLPAFLSKNWKTASIGSTIRMSFNYVPEAPAYLQELEDAKAYELTAEDYQAVWGNSEADYLTPSKSPDKNLPKVLDAAMEKPVFGDYVVVTYKYSDTEPSGNEPVGPAEDFREDFEQITPDADVNLSGWVNFTEKGTKRTWQGKSHSGNKYVQFSANGSGEDENVAWLVSPGIDLSVYTAPVFTFNMKIGYYNANCLQILVSEDFSGDPVTATWKDITSNFSLPQQPASGYASNWSIAGMVDMKGYENKVYIAFKYTGSGTGKKTTTYQIDNVFVGDQPSVTKNLVVDEKFDGVKGNEDVKLPEWVNFTEKGTKRTWQGKSYGDNKYVQFSANGSGEDENVAWLITPSLTVNSGVTTLFSFDLKVGYYNADCLQILVSDDFAEDPLTATWKDISSYFTIPQEPDNGFATDFSLAGTVDLSAYVGNVRIAFKYTGSGTGKKTTTYQLDNLNVAVYSAITNTKSLSVRAGKNTEDCLAMYNYDGTNWKKAEKVAMVNPADYKAMGKPGINNNFSSSVPAADYLPQFLEQKYPYAQAEDTVTVVYNYYDSGSKKSVLKADEYVFTTAWTYNTRPVTVVTEQYAYAEGSWKFSPNVVITLKPGKGLGDGHFQALTDWVWENVDQKEGITKKGEGYVTSYGNNDYYYGGSEYQNNFDFRAANWKAQNEKAYGKMSDEELSDLMWKRLPEAVQRMLMCMYQDIKPGEVPVTYVVNFAVFDMVDGSYRTRFFTSHYKLSGPGEFTYIENSLQEIKSL